MPLRPLLPLRPAFAVHRFGARADEIASVGEGTEQTIHLVQQSVAQLVGQLINPVDQHDGASTAKLAVGPAAGHFAHGGPHQLGEQLGRREASMVRVVGRDPIAQPNVEGGVIAQFREGGRTIAICQTDCQPAEQGGFARPAFADQQDARFGGDRLLEGQLLAPQLVEQRGDLFARDLLQQPPLVARIAQPRLGPQRNAISRCGAVHRQIGQQLIQLRALFRAERTGTLHFQRKIGAGEWKIFLRGIDRAADAEEVEPVEPPQNLVVVFPTVLLIFM